MNIFALDLGNKQTKLYSDKLHEKGEKEGKMKAKVNPSRFMYKSDLGNSSTALFSQKAQVKTYKSAADEEEYAWGPEMYKLHNDNKFLDTISFENRYEKEEFKLLADFALAELASDYGAEATDGILPVTVVTGVPSDDFNEEDVPQIMKVLKGDHTVSIDGVSHIVRVNEVHVLPQSVGTVYNEILDNDGFVIPEKESMLEEEIVVNDIGGGTYLINVLRNMNLASSYQFPTGLYELHEEIVRMAKEESSQYSKLTTYEVDHILKTGSFENGFYYKPNKDTSYDLTAIVKRANNKYTREIINKSNSAIKNFSSVDTNLYTGGGANLIDQERIMAQYKRAIFVADSESASVRGFWKYGKALALESEEAAATTEE